MPKGWVSGGCRGGELGEHEEYSERGEWVESDTSVLLVMRSASIRWGANLCYANGVGKQAGCEVGVSHLVISDISDERVGAR